MNAYEREEDILCEQVNSGAISTAEFNAAMRDMQEEIRWNAQEAADSAYNDYMCQW